MILASTFFKPYISKICNGFSFYIYIRFRIQFDLYFSIFTFNNSFATKIKILDGHMTQNWTPIESQFRIKLDLNFLIFTLNNLLGTKIKN